MKPLFTFFAFLVILVWYGWFMPREEIVFENGASAVAVLPFESEPDTFTIDARWTDQFNPPEHTVMVTVYYAVVAQCDDTPHITADGTKFDISIAGSYRYCALSRDLLTKFDENAPYTFGDKIVLAGAGNLSGVWIVRDTMNKRFTNRIDLLVNPEVGLKKFVGAKIRKET